MKDHENESVLEVEKQLQKKSSKKDSQNGILLPILYALLAAIGGFTLVMLIGIAITILNGPPQSATAAVPSQAVTRPEGITQSSYQYFKEKAAEEAANLPPVQTEGPSAEPSEGLFPDPEQSAPPAPVQSTEPTPAPTRSPSTAPSGVPVQTTSPVVPSTRPVQQPPTQSGNQSGGGSQATHIHDFSGGRVLATTESNNKNDPVYHIKDCTSAQKILPENAYWYDSAQAAIDAGRRLCGNCAR